MRKKGVEPNYSIQATNNRFDPFFVLAGLFLHGKAVKQTVATRADQCSLAATPGVVGRVPGSIVMMTDPGLAIVAATRPVIAAHVLASWIRCPIGL
jgi:hypothetical protein